MADEVIIDVGEKCKVCGDQRAIVKAGYQYCLECGTRLVESQALDFSQDFDDKPHLKTKTIKNVSENVKLGEMWTSWHIHNMILVGLCEELECCCSRERELKKSTFKIWAYFLRRNRIAFFKPNSQNYPKLPFGSSLRDFNYLYDIKKPQKVSKRQVPKNITQTRRNISTKKMILAQQQFENFMASQKSTQPIISSNLEDLKKSQDIQKPSTISITSKTRSLLRKSLTSDQINQHLKKGYCGPGCRCLLTRSHNLLKWRRFRMNLMNLYAILILALRINNDEVQVSDVIRWCREGHLSYGNYDHFLPDDLIFKKTDKKFNMNIPILMTHHRIRQNVNSIMRHLNFDNIKPPDIQFLIRKYIIELELPSQLFIYTQKLMYNNVLDYSPNLVSFLPNYEGIAMAYIIVALKMLFGFDGKIENETSKAIARINELLQLKMSKKMYPKDFTVFSNDDLPNLRENKLFVLKEWMEYIEYRKICLAEYHYPSRIKLYPDSCDKSDLFLHHRKTNAKNFTAYEPKNPTNLSIKSIMERVLDCYDIVEEKYPRFYPSLYPMNSYVETLLTWSYYPSEPAFNKDILEEDFTAYDIYYTSVTKGLKASLSKLGVALTLTDHRYIRCDESLYKEKNRSATTTMFSNEDVEVLDCSTTDWTDMTAVEEIKEILKNLQKEKASQGNELQFQRSVQTENEHMKSEECIRLAYCHNKYWIRHYQNFSRRFSIAEFKYELEKHFPKSFVWLLKQCADLVEMDVKHLYYEVCKLEKTFLTEKDS